MEATRNLCAQVPVSLHAKVLEEKTALGQSLSEYITQILKGSYTTPGWFNVKMRACPRFLRQNGTLSARFLSPQGQIRALDGDSG